MLSRYVREAVGVVTRWIAEKLQNSLFPTGSRPLQHKPPSVWEVHTSPKNCQPALFKSGRACDGNDHAIFQTHAQGESAKRSSGPDPRTGSRGCNAVWDGRASRSMVCASPLQRALLRAAAASPRSDCGVVRQGATARCGVGACRMDANAGDRFLLVPVSSQLA